MTYKAYIYIYIYIYYIYIYIYKLLFDFDGNFLCRTIVDINHRFRLNAGDESWNRSMNRYW